VSPKLARIVGSACAAVALLSAPAIARSAPKVELGLRTGYGFPFGNAYGGGNLGVDYLGHGYPSTALGDIIVGQVPLWFDVGARLTDRHYVGAYLSYGFGIEPGERKARCYRLTRFDIYSRLLSQLDPNSTDVDVSCSTSDMRLGARYAYHLGSPKELDPWVGIGVGYEWARSMISRGPDSIKMSLRGWEFVNLELGLDLPVAEQGAIVPFLTFALAEYGSASPLAPPYSSGSISDRTLHGWLFLGVHGSFVM